MFIFIFPIMLFVLLASVYGGKYQRPARQVRAARRAPELRSGQHGVCRAGDHARHPPRGGLLKRLRSTPLPAPAYLAAVIVSMLVVFALETVALFAIGRLAFGMALPHNVGSLALLVVIGIAGFGGLGFAAASLIRSAEGASAVLNVVLLPMAFLSGAFGPTRHLPEVLRWVAEVLPLKYFVDLARAVYLNGQHVWTKPAAIAAVLAWGAAGFVVAARRFGWEPRDR